MFSFATALVSSSLNSLSGTLQARTTTPNGFVPTRDRLNVLVLACTSLGYGTPSAWPHLIRMRVGTMSTGWLSYKLSSKPTEHFVALYPNRSGFRWRSSLCSATFCLLTLLVCSLAGSLAWFSCAPQCKILSNSLPPGQWNVCLACWWALSGTKPGTLG